MALSVAPGARSKSTALPVALGSPTFQGTSLSVENYSADTVTVKYTGLPANQPHAYGNFVAIWEDSVIPWTAPPLASKVIPQDRSTGTATLTGLTIGHSSYVVGYGVGPGVSTICASALLSAGGLRLPPSSVQISLSYVGTDSVIVHYETLSGYLPATNHNWVGLWRSYVSPYGAPEPLGTVLIPQDSTSGNVAIDGVSIGIGSPYTLIYYMGNPEEQKKNTLAAAILTFETEGAEAGS